MLRGPVMAEQASSVSPSEPFQVVQSISWLAAPGSPGVYVIPLSAVTERFVSPTWILIAGVGWECLKAFGDRSAFCAIPFDPEICGSRKRNPTPAWDIGLGTCLQSI